MNKCTGVMGLMFGHKWTHQLRNVVVGSDVVQSRFYRCERCGVIRTGGAK